MNYINNTKGGYALLLVVIVALAVLALFTPSVMQSHAAIYQAQNHKTKIITAAGIARFKVMELKCTTDIDKIEAQTRKDAGMVNGVKYETEVSCYQTKIENNNTKVYGEIKVYDADKKELVYVLPYEITAGDIMGQLVDEMTKK